jgi:poly-gamma-glutamate capsule biosynthesis protein CapA/YwtB (metallophosphatase superfamily)
VPDAKADSLSVFFLGDTYFGESYQTNSKYNDGVNVIDEYGYDYFFENVKGLLKNSDHTIINLETSLNPPGTVQYPEKPYLHWSYGIKTCAYLAKYGVDAVSLGNNHVMDYGSEGYIATTTMLDSFGLQWFGAGLNDSLAAIPYTRTLSMETGNFELAVIGGFEYRRSYENKYDFYAGENKQGVNKLIPERIITQVKQLKDQNKNIFIVFYPHWGKNYKPAMDYQKEMAHALIDAGVDLIIGHGSHTIQETEMYKDKWIIYNIGNFIFNAPGRYRSKSAKPYGLMAELVIKDSGKLLKLHPIFTDNKRSDYQVRFLDEDEFEDYGKLIGGTGVINKSKGDRSFFEIKLN